MCVYKVILEYDNDIIVEYLINFDGHLVAELGRYVWPVDGIYF